MTRGLRERLEDGVVLGDGGYLLELEKRGYVQAGPFTPEVVIEHPDALAQLHREFLRAGVDVLQTMTFYASDDKLATVGLEGKVDEINRNAVRIASDTAADAEPHAKTVRLTQGARRGRASRTRTATHRRRNANTTRRSVASRGERR